MDDRFRIEEEPQRKRQLGMGVVAGCLASTLVVYHAWGVLEGKGEKPPATKKTTATALIDAPESTSKAEPISWPAIPYDELILVNPFQPKTPSDQADVDAVERELKESREAKQKKQASAREQASERELSPRVGKVRLLFQSARGAAAVIGDRVVYEGDRIEGYQVVAIDHDGVVLELLTDVDAASR